MQKIRLWTVTPENTVSEIQSDGISLEEPLEKWLENDIAMLDPDLLVIGRQVKTNYGGIIDLLCIDADGALVVVELKRGKTPREVTAQALDYASWAKDLNSADIEAIADRYLERSLKEAFEAKFEVDLPEVLNESHRSVVVAETIDESTERVVRYLADFGVPINVATVQHFKDSAGRQLLAQVYLVEPEMARAKARAVSKRTRADKLKQQQALAHGHGIGDLFAALWKGVAKVLWPSDASDNRVRYTLRTADGRSRTVLIVWSDRSNDGGMPFLVHVDRMAAHLGMSRELLASALPDNAKETDRVRKWVGASAEEKQNAIGIKGVFHSIKEVHKFADAVQKAARQ